MEWLKESFGSFGTVIRILVNLQVIAIVQSQNFMVFVKSFCNYESHTRNIQGKLETSLKHYDL
jgi:hypothetical protein